MDNSLPTPGSWFRSPAAKGTLFRYEGQGPDGAYIFSKFNSRDPNNPGELVTTIEIYNLDAMEPLDTPEES